MSRLKPVKAERVVKALNKLVFQMEGQKGSHLAMKHSNGRVTVLPIYDGEVLGKRHAEANRP